MCVCPNESAKNSNRTCTFIFSGTIDIKKTTGAAVLFEFMNKTYINVLENSDKTELRDFCLFIHGCDIYYTLAAFPCKEQSLT